MPRGLIRCFVAFLFVVLLAACGSAQAAGLPARVPPTPVAVVPTATASTTAALTAVPILTAAVSLPTGTPSPSPSVTPSLTPSATAAAGTVIAPILLYHRVSDTGSTRYILTVSQFRQQMKYLKEHGYQSITISQLADAIRKGAQIPEKPVVITFDDGYEDTFENAFPILQEYGFKATVYVITGTLGTDKSYGYMQDDALKALVQAGWEIGSHSVTHNDLSKSKLGMGNEMTQSKKTLEDHLGIQVRSFSYPFGLANESIKELAAHSGYDSAVGLDTLITHTPNQLFYLNRREVHRSMGLTTFATLLEPGESDHLMATMTAVATEMKK